MNDRTPDLREGYVTLHKGIFDPSVLPMSGLLSQRMDWRGPNAMITIKMVN